jgi:hypothetical protein
MLNCGYRAGGAGLKLLTKAGAPCLDFQTWVSAAATILEAFRKLKTEVFRASVDTRRS